MYIPANLNADLSRPTPASVDRMLVIARAEAHRRWKRSARQYDLDALLSDVHLAVLRARDDWDPARGAGFGTLATARVRGAILEHFRTAQDLKRRAYARLKAGQEPRADELPPVPLHAPVRGGEGEPLTLLESLPDPGPETGHAALTRLRDRALHAYVDGLPEKTRRAVRGCYLDGKTQPEVARELGLSKERVRQLCEQGRERLKPLMAAWA